MIIKCKKTTYFCYSCLYNNNKTIIATAIKALTGAIEKEEIPTFEELAEITRLVAELTATVVPDEDKKIPERCL